jgi:hypothetical protein
MTAPLPFFPSLSFEYSTRTRKGESVSMALAKATRTYTEALDEGENGFVTPEICPEVARLYGEEAPLAEDWPERRGLDGLPSFSVVSERVWGPCEDAVEPLTEPELQQFKDCADVSTGLSMGAP